MEISNSISPPNYSFYIRFHSRPKNLIWPGLKQMKVKNWISINSMDLSKSGLLNKNLPICFCIFTCTEARDSTHSHFWNSSQSFNKMRPCKVIARAHIRIVFSLYFLFLLFPRQENNEVRFRRCWWNRKAWQLILNLCGDLQTKKLFSALVLHLSLESILFQIICQG